MDKCDKDSNDTLEQLHHRALARLEAHSCAHGMKLRKISRVMYLSTSWSARSNSLFILNRIRQSTATNRDNF